MSALSSSDAYVTGQSDKLEENMEPTADCHSERYDLIIAILSKDFYSLYL